MLKHRIFYIFIIHLQTILHTIHKISKLCVPSFINSLIFYLIYITRNNRHIRIFIFSIGLLIAPLKIYLWLLIWLVFIILYTLFFMLSNGFILEWFLVISTLLVKDISLAVWALDSGSRWFLQHDFFTAICKTISEEDKTHEHQHA